MGDVSSTGLASRPQYAERGMFSRHSFLFLLLDDRSSEASCCPVASVEIELHRCSLSVGFGESRQISGRFLGGATADFAWIQV